MGPRHAASNTTKLNHLHSFLTDRPAYSRPLTNAGFWQFREKTFLDAAMLPRSLYSMKTLHKSTKFSIMHLWSVVHSFLTEYCAYRQQDVKSVPAKRPPPDYFL